jgi:hypothetical protein
MTEKEVFAIEFATVEAEVADGDSVLHRNVLIGSLAKEVERCARWSGPTGVPGNRRPTLWSRRDGSHARRRCAGDSYSRRISATEAAEMEGPVVRAGRRRRSSCSPRRRRRAAGLGHRPWPGPPRQRRHLRWHREPMPERPGARARAVPERRDNHEQRRARTVRSTRISRSAIGPGHAARPGALSQGGGFAGPTPRAAGNAGATTSPPVTASQHRRT